MLTFNLKKEWFEKIKTGEKKCEYRLANSYWTKRLLKIFQKYSGIRLENMKNFSIPVDEKCVFCLGYPKKNDKSRRLSAKITRFARYSCGLGTDLNTPEAVFELHFNLIEGKQNV